MGGTWKGFWRSADTSSMQAICVFDTLQNAGISCAWTGVSLCSCLGVYLHSSCILLLKEDGVKLLLFSAGAWSL